MTEDKDDCGDESSPPVRHFAVGLQPGNGFRPARSGQAVPDAANFVLHKGNVRGACRRESGYHYGMTISVPLHIDVAQYPSKARWFMGIAWAVTLAKCYLVWWAVEHWHMPFHPGWIVFPTLTFAGLATVIWLTHHRE
jgi:hypothetical protein